MNIETVTLSTLAPSRANPRKSIDAHGFAQPLPASDAARLLSGQAGRMPFRVAG